MSIQMTKEEIKRARYHLNMTQTEFGKACGGYAKCMVATWESGTRKIPKAVVQVTRWLLEYGE